MTPVSDLVDSGESTCFYRDRCMVQLRLRKLGYQRGLVQGAVDGDESIRTLPAGLVYLALLAMMKGRLLTRTRVWCNNNYSAFCSYSLRSSFCYEILFGAGQTY